MTITFTGDIPSSTERVLTKSYTLNQALRDVKGNSGFPLRSLVELYGPKGVGKTSLALSVLGSVAVAKSKGISILDFEGQEKGTVEASLMGVVTKVTFTMFKWLARSAPRILLSVSVTACLTCRARIKPMKILT